MIRAHHRSFFVPDAWSALDLTSLRGVLVVIGAPNTGKTAFAHWLHDQLAGPEHPTAFLDGDVGQSVLGPPTTLTLALPSKAGNDPKDSGSLVHWFVGDVSPRGCMLPLVVGAGRLTRQALEAGAKTVIMDTTGLVDRAQGGVALKHALVDQLCPTTLFALQRVSELEPILMPLRRQPRLRVVELPVANVVRRRDVPERQAHRAAAFRRYFAGAGVCRLSLRRHAVFGGRVFAPQRLVALQDAAGFALALGVIADLDETKEELIIRTPLVETDAVVSIRLGAVGVDVETGRELRPGRSL